MCDVWTWYRPRDRNGKIWSIRRIWSSQKWVFKSSAKSVINSWLSANHAYLQTLYSWGPATVKARLSTAERVEYASCFCSCRHFFINPLVHFSDLWISWQAFRSLASRFNWPASILRRALNASRRLNFLSIVTHVESTAALAARRNLRSCCSRRWERRSYVPSMESATGSRANDPQSLGYKSQIEVLVMVKSQNKNISIWAIQLISVKWILCQR